MGYYPNLRNEKKLKRKGFKYIAGIDEAGKGSWAGPVLAAVVILDYKIKIIGIKDSKLLRKPARVRIYEEIIKKAVAWSIGTASSSEIDKMGIDKANKLAMERALEKITPQPDFILIDAVNLNYKETPSLPIIDGDHKVMTIAAASIVAKVSRDKIMDELDEKYPQYGFKHHKGYGTNHHFHMLNQYGLCSLHRKTWEPMKHFPNN
jgi:ribonuclease HII